MKIVILNGNERPSNKKFEAYLNNYSKDLSSKKNTVKTFSLWKTKINYCCGCWTCWWKTPGRCIFKDDMHHIYKETINADLLIFASPIVMGYPSSLTKKTMDRLIPLLIPYIEIIDGECHHKIRYSNSPKIGLLLEKEKDTDKQDLKIINDLYKRFALNFSSELIFLKLI